MCSTYRWCVGARARYVGTGAVACVLLCVLAAAEPAVDRPFVSRAQSAPRKVIVATTQAGFTGSLESRLTQAARLIDAAADDAREYQHGRELDLMVFPEFAIEREPAASAAERAVELRGAVMDALSAKAREHHTWLVVPMTLREPDAGGRISNAAVLFDRRGAVAGVFRKVHPIVDAPGVFEGGVTPGEVYPVFTCDFGKLGILICWDMAYDEAWDALAAGGAEIVALPSASPQTLRPMAAALRHRFYVVNSTPRDNASIFDPIGQTAAQITTAGVLVHEVDLAYAILHWSEGLQEGRALKQRYGAAVGFSYSQREDTGVFWSNDPKRSIGSMIGELNLREMPVVIEEMESARRAAKG